MLRAAQREYGWKLDPGAIARIWRGGCIIRAAFLHEITRAYLRNPDLPNLLLDPHFARAMRKAQPNWRRAVSMAVECGVPTPAFSSALAYFDGYRSKRLPANVIQGQRDYFGSHTYERVDRPRGKHFHLEWSSAERAEVPA